MATDNIRTADRDKFELLYIEVMEALLHHAIELQLPNAYMETIVARMLAMRSAACDEELSVVTDRVVVMAQSYTDEHADTYEHARALGRKMRAWQGVKH